MHLSLDIAYYNLYNFPKFLFPCMAGGGSSKVGVGLQPGRADAALPAVVLNNDNNK